MTDADIIDIIEEGIVDGTDMDCTVKDQARAVLKALRDAGVLLPPIYSRRKLVAQVAAVTALANELSWDKKTRPISERIRAALEQPQ